MTRTSRPGLALLLVLVLLPFGVGLPASADDPGGQTRDADWRRFDAAFATVAPGTNFLAAEVRDGACIPVHGLTPDRRLAVGSTFKLYVLAELARQVAAGEVAWSESLPIQDALKSLPSGGMRYQPEGLRHSLRHYAERMIEDSDNTATDHLIARLGRENVEAAQAPLGHGDPAVNTPFLLTREMFAFKISIPADDTDAYLTADDATQRRFLADRVGPMRFLTEDLGEWVAPKRIDSIEWFASATEICRALAHLAAMAEQPDLAPIWPILGLNRGGVLDRAAWPYTGHKGGYEAGVLNLTWLLRRADDRLFVVTAGFNDPVYYVDQAAAWTLVLDAVERLSEAP